MFERLSSSARVVIVLVAVIMITFLVFSGTMRYDFVNFDDDIYVRKNPHVQTMSWENTRWFFSNIFYKQYIPLTMLSHTVDYAIWQSDARGHHLANVILHSLNTGWVFLLGLLAIGIARQSQTGGFGSFSFA